MNILVFAPHPDDDVIGAGGSIINHRLQGDTVSIAYLTSGDAGDRKADPKKLAAVREKEACLASEVLGVSDLVFLRYRDGDIPLTQDSIRKVTQLITDKKPDTVYIPHENDGHRDHRICHTLVTEAIWRAGFNAFQDISGDPWQTATVLTYEVWTPLSAVAVIHDVTGVMDRKLTALRKHASQIRNVAYDEAVSGLNRYRGATTGKGTYCECFGVVRTGSV